MTKDKMREKGNILIVLVVIAALAVGVVFYLKSKPPTIPTTSYKSPSATSQPTSTKSAEQTKIFQSKNLNLSLQYTSKWRIEEGRTFVNLLSRDGKVNVSRIATNFDDISGYINDFDSKRKIEVKTETNLRINGYPTLSRIEIFKGGPITKQKVYYIYIKGWVYSFSTDSESLFNNLDQIAQTFRYTP